MRPIVMYLLLLTYAALNGGMDQRDLITDLALKDVIFPVVRIPRWSLTALPFIGLNLGRHDIAGALISTRVHNLDHVCAIKKDGGHVNLYDTVNRGIHKGSLWEAARMSVRAPQRHRAIVYLQKKVNWPG